jgi:dihydropteroate synthase
MIWRCRDRIFELEQRVLVMGILNVTPDSFSDGGRYVEPAAALERARAMLEEGADLIDLGAESTRPGSAPVAEDEQWRRLVRVLPALVAEGVCVSIDTAHAGVAKRALEAGAEIVNDITALGHPAMAALVAGAGAGVVLMHMQGNPATMQKDPRYDDAPREVTSWLAGRLEVARSAGIAAECVALDPGVGFGKRVSDSLELIARLDVLAALGRPVLMGASRKSFIGRVSGAEVGDRLEGGIAAHAVAVFQGARIIRTHDVRATVRAVSIAGALRAVRAGALPS